MLSGPSMQTAAPGRILVIDDEAPIRELVRDALLERGHEVTTDDRAETAIERLSSSDFDAVITDLHLEGMDGLSVCRFVSSNRPGLPVIVATGYGNVDSAVGALRAGAYDFVVKPLDLETLSHVVARALEHARLDREVRRLRQEVQNRDNLEGLLGASVAMRTLLQRVTKAIETDANVLVTGESGTGKELVARALHTRGARRSGPFVAVDCASIPAPVLESELFGHVRGAFTDARSDRTGLFVRANGGTLFLDEIGEMPLELQSKLLRALQQRKVRPLGSNDEIPFDARLIAATNRDLEDSATNGRFRRDLYYRINVVHIDMPPLRARGNDVLLLAQHFLTRAASRSGKRIDGLVRSAAEKLLAYDWPGNVRELENCIESAVALAEHDKITVADLSARIRNHHPSVLVVGTDPKDLVTLDEMERRYIRQVMAAVGGNKTQAAKILDVERRTLYRKLQRFEN
jgi:two-component system, NtrC family, response regulator AtoC